MASSLALLERSAAELAAATCAAWPELETSMGGQPACERQLSGYYLSYATYLGLTAEP